MLYDNACCDWGQSRLLCGCTSQADTGLLTSRLVGGSVCARGTGWPQPLAAPACRAQGFLLTTQPRGNWCGVFLDNRTALQEEDRGEALGGGQSAGAQSQGASGPPGGVPLPCPCCSLRPCARATPAHRQSESTPRCSWTCICLLCSQWVVRVAELVPLSYLESDCPCGVALARVLRSLRF